MPIEGQKQVPLKQRKVEEIPKQEENEDKTKHIANGEIEKFAKEEAGGKKGKT